MLAEIATIGMLPLGYMLFVLLNGGLFLSILAGARLVYLKRWTQLIISLAILAAGIAWNLWLSWGFYPEFLHSFLKGIQGNNSVLIENTESVRITSVLCALASSIVSAIFSAIYASELLRDLASHNWPEWAQGDAVWRAAAALDGAFKAIAAKSVFMITTLQFVLLTTLSLGKSIFGTSIPAQSGLFLLVGTSFGLYFLFRNLLFLAFPTNVLLEKSLLLLNSSSKGSRPHFGPFGPRVAASRWRGPTHRNGVIWARCLERSTSGLRKKMTPSSYAEIRSSLTSAAEYVRRNAIEDPNPATDDIYKSITISAIAFAVNDNPIAVSRKIHEIVPDEYVTGRDGRSRIAKILERADGALQRYSRIFTIVLGLALLVFLVSTGKVDKAVDIVQSVVAPSSV